MVAFAPGSTCTAWSSFGRCASAWWPTCPSWPSRPVFGYHGCGEREAGDAQPCPQVGGVLIIAFEFVVAGIVPVPMLMRERRFDLSRIRPGPGGAVPLGMAFALG